MSYSINLEGRVALVTGASSGLGAQFARTLSQAGACVVLAGRRIERLKDLRAEIEGNGGDAHVVQRREEADGRALRFHHLKSVDVADLAGGQCRAGARDRLTKPRPRPLTYTIYRSWLPADSHTTHPTTMTFILHNPLLCLHHTAALYHLSSHELRVDLIPRLVVERVPEVLQHL